MVADRIEIYPAATPKKLGVGHQLCRTIRNLYVGNMRPPAGIVTQPSVTANTMRKVSTAHNPWSGRRSNSSLRIQTEKSPPALPKIQIREYCCRLTQPSLLFAA